MDAILTLHLHGRRPVADLYDVPSWIESNITCGQLAAIADGGCDGGAYLPAVTYLQAMGTMAKHGDAVLDYLSNAGVSVSFDVEEDSWAGFACKLCAAAVTAWASCAAKAVAVAIEAEVDGKEEKEEEEEEKFDINDEGVAGAM